MQKIFCTFLMALMLVASPLIANNVSAQTFDIAATVNKDAISETDLNDRIKLVLISAGLKNTKSNQAKARSQALNSLIEEQLKIQEAERQAVGVTEEEVTQGFETIAAQNKLEAAQFTQVLKHQGIPKTTLLNQIKAQVAWSKVIAKVLRPRVEVSENDMRAKMDRIKDNMGKIEYKTSEIFLPVNDDADERQTMELARKLIQEIKDGNATFDVVATQFSKSATAVDGGDMGWVQEGQLAQELNVVVKSLTKGQISPPIRSLSGVYVLTVSDKRSVSGDTLPTEDDVLSSIGLERLDRLQQRYLSDLRSSAFIDTRG